MHKVHFEILALTSRTLHGQTPSCEAELLRPYSTARNLRSNLRNLLSVNSCCPSFEAVAPELWKLCLHHEGFQIQYHLTIISKHIAFGWITYSMACFFIFFVYLFFLFVWLCFLLHRLLLCILLCSSNCWNVLTPVIANLFLLTILHCTFWPFVCDKCNINTPYLHTYLQIGFNKTYEGWLKWFHIVSFQHILIHILDTDPLASLVNALGSPERMVACTNVKFRIKIKKTLWQPKPLS